MKRIPFLQWVKMLLVVGVHLWVAWLLVRPYVGVACEYANEASDYLVSVYSLSERWTVEKWHELPSLDELGRKFVEILKKPLN